MTEDALLVWGLALYGVALLLVVVEMFLPSGGVIGLLAALVAIAGDVCLWLVEPLWGVLGLLVILVGGPLIFFFCMQIVLPSTPIGRKLLYGEEGADNSPDTLVEQNPFDALVGKEGVALTDLRPVGAAKIDGQRHEVLAETVHINVGSQVRVVSVRGNEIKVRAIAR